MLCFKVYKFEVSISAKKPRCKSTIDEVFDLYVYGLWDLLRINLKFDFIPLFKTFKVKGESLTQ